MENTVREIIGAYCNRTIKINGEMVRYHSVEVENLLVRINLENISKLQTQEEVNSYLEKLAKSKS